VWFVLQLGGGGERCQEMRLADPELGGQAPWDALLKTPATLKTHMEENEDQPAPQDESRPQQQSPQAPQAAAAAPQEERQLKSVLVNNNRVAKPPPPIRRRHTLGETINSSLQPLLNHNRLMQYNQVDANGRVNIPNTSPFRSVSFFICLFFSAL
jgi:hypothetical protein